MRPRRPAQWKDIPSSSELAALTRCEAEFVWERNVQTVSASPERLRKAARGERAHLQTQMEMERHHNARPRRPAVGVGARAARPVQAPAPAPALREPPPVAPAAGTAAPMGPAAGGESRPPASPVPHIPRSSTDRRCFVASAVYGADDPRTDQLRQFRDTYLMGSATGRGVVQLYYTLSPGLARAIATVPGLRPVVVRALDLIRHRLPHGSGQVS